jgi:hypothetical protein
MRGTAGALSTAHILRARRGEDQLAPAAPYGLALDIVAYCAISMMSMWGTKRWRMNGRRWTIALVLLGNPLVAVLVQANGQSDWMQTFTFMGVVALLAIALTEK